MAYTDIDDPSEYFHTQLYTGTGSNQDVVNDAHAGDFKPDFLIIKNRSNGNYGVHIYDSTRGVKRYLYTDQNYGDDQETHNGNGTGSVQLFNTNGFRGGSSTNIYNILWTNGLNSSYVAWQWKINGGTTSTLSNTGPDSVVQVNTTMGVSVLTYTGNGSNSNVKHGLGEVPDMIWVKRRDGGDADWAVWHKDLGTSSYFLKLNTTAAEASGVWDGVYPSSEKFFISGGSSFTNVNGSNYVAYVFKSKQGFSKIDKYVGNGNANGPFVYTGFKPAFVMTKRTDSAGDWIITDLKRSGYNGGNKELFPNLTQGEDSDSRYDLLSNGFKINVNYATSNASGGTYVYMAFAENPFVTSTGIMGTAR
jgi:hypothetical protein